jgi:hypothetical protein
MRRNAVDERASGVDAAANSHARAFSASVIDAGRFSSSAVKANAFPCWTASGGTMMSIGSELSSNPSEARAAVSRSSAMAVEIWECSTCRPEP